MKAKYDPWGLELGEGGQGEGHPTNLRLVEFTAVSVFHTQLQQPCTGQCSINVLIISAKFALRSSICASRNAENPAPGICLTPKSPFK